MYELICGNIFDQKCDLIIIPCNTHGGVTGAIEKELKENNIIYNPQTIIAGKVRFVNCSSGCQISSIAGFAASVSVMNMGRIKELVKNICEEIIRFCIEKSLYTVNIPLLGTGAGRLEPQESMDVIKQCFANEKNLHIRIYVLSKDIYQVLSEKNEYEYDVALSFAGEDRAYVEVIANKLKNRGIKVFFDKFEISKLWGKDLYPCLNHIYKDSAKYCVIFVSKSYKNKAWTQHELKSAQNRAFIENKEYILPIFLEHVKLDGINDTIGYINASEFSESEIVDLIIEKLQ